MERNQEKYKHLQFILNRQKHMNLGLGQLYLVVNEIGFGVYRLDDVDYHNGIVRLLFINPVTDDSADISLDITNKHTQTFLINWNDIKDLVYGEMTCNYNDEELLELENE
jgi:hypothetical protein